MVTTDAVVMRLGAGGLEALIHRRAREPFAGTCALPGVYVARGETISEATRRCVSTKGGLDLPSAPDTSRTLEVYDDLGRDPRGHALSVVTLAVLHGSDAREPSIESAKWEPLVEVGLRTRTRMTGADLAFDHEGILADAVEWLGSHLWQDPYVFRSLLGGGSVSTSRLQHVAVAVGRGESSTSNFRRKIRASGLFVESDAFDESPTQRGRPSRLWEWR